MENIFEKKLEKSLEKQRVEINFEELKEERDKIYSNRESYKLLLNFVKKLQDKYPDYQNYKIYHCLFGSSLPEKGNFKEEDFPGEDSIVNFLNSFKEEK